MKNMFKSSRVNMYIYNILGVYLISNLEFIRLSKNRVYDNITTYKDRPVIETRISIGTDVKNEGPYGVRYNADDSIEVTFKHSYYHLLLKEKIIVVRAISMDMVFFTLFNVPFSFMLNSLGMVMLHSSSCILNNRLLAFTAEKGVGKSTLLLKMLQYGVRMYSDDSLTIADNNYLSFNSHSALKTKDEKLCKLCGDEKYVYDERIQKFIFEGDVVPQCRRLDRIYVLQRGNYDDYSILEINRRSERIAVLLNGIVGIKYYNNKQKFKLLKSPVFQELLENMSIYYLFVPDEKKMGIKKLDGIIECL